MDKCKPLLGGYFIFLPEGVDEVYPNLNPLLGDVDVGNKVGPQFDPMYEAGGLLRTSTLLTLIRRILHTLMSSSSSSPPICLLLLVLLLLLLRLLLSSARLYEHSL
jgi:hypothetical protein